MSIAKRLVVIGVVFLCVFTAGTIAFMLVEGWPFMDSLYMTTITIFSVGFQEVHPLETRGRILTILL
ncbi:MAG TPA: ion channel, partial [Candidatus Methylomirabilis sp.]